MARKLLYLNGLAITSVIVYHAVQWGYVVMFYAPPVGEVNFSQVGSIAYYVMFLISQFVTYAIPSFIFVSGYFIVVATSQNSKTVTWSTVFNRIKILVIPFLIWSTLNLLFRMLLGDRYSPFDFFFRIITGRVAGRTYFIPLLIQLYLLAPILVLLVRKWAKTILVASAIVQIFVYFSRYIIILYPGWQLFEILSSKRFFSAHVFWFVLGIFVGFNITRVKAILVHYRKFFLAGAFVFFFIGVIEADILFRVSNGSWHLQTFGMETLLDQPYSLFVLLAFLAYEKNQFPFFEQILDLGTRSYGIYLTHTFALSSVAQIMYRYWPFGMEHQILFQPILIVSGFAFSLSLMGFVQKTFPGKYYKYLFG